MKLTTSTDWWRRPSARSEIDHRARAENDRFESILQLQEVATTARAYHPSERSTSLKWRSVVRWIQIPRALDERQ